MALFAYCFGLLLSLLVVSGSCFSSFANTNILQSASVVGVDEKSESSRRRRRSRSVMSLTKTAGSTRCRQFIYALDFDGVLVNSAAELCLSGFDAAKILFDGEPWLKRKLRRPDQIAKLVDNFCEVRPCLETGWEAPLLLKLISEGRSNHDIMSEFQHGLRDEMMSTLGVTKESCNNALKRARNDWIGEDKDADDWLAAHGFYEGACDAVRQLLSDGKASDVYIITTKAADFSCRLLEKQKLYGKDAPGGGIPSENIFGLGSGPKPQVLASLLNERGDDYAAVFVEDRLLTLQDTMKDTTICHRVLPVLASWGYNTQEQRNTSKESGYTVLSQTDSSTLAQVMDSIQAEQLLNDFDQHFS
mmetsp:Transcript_9763/g.13802  ORF Transcript_9763/g.13802 Transcript_9763/m.13802 type:complete len:360 (-) Transcript_9763:54-1133(-)